MAKIIRWNANKILAKVPKVLKEYGDLAAVEAVTQLTTVKWPWDHPTLRFESRLMGGTPVGDGIFVSAGPRDIVDTGQLLESQQPPVVTNNSMTITWTAPYAMRVLIGGSYGEYVNPNGELVQAGGPARNWIDGTYEALPPRQIFLNIWRSTPAR